MREIVGDALAEHSAVTRGYLEDVTLVERTQDRKDIGRYYPTALVYCALHCTFINNNAPFGLGCERDPVFPIVHLRNRSRDENRAYLLMDSLFQGVFGGPVANHNFDRHLGRDSGSPELGEHASSPGLADPVTHADQVIGDALDLANEFGPLRFRVPVIQSLDVREDDKEVGVDGHRDMGRESVIVPEGGLLYIHDRDGVVLVDDRDDAAGKERVQGVPDI